MIDIDNYLNWYEPKTIEYRMYDIKSSKYQHIKKVVGLMEYRLMLNTSNSKTKTLIDKYKPIAESLKVEIEAMSDTIKLHAFTIDSLKMNPTYYIPTLEDWHYLHTNRKEFLNVEKTSIADKLNFATLEMLRNKANEFLEWINDYKCKEFIDNINPLPYGAKWYDFIMYVHWIDCYNYYNELATPQPEQNETIKHTMKKIHWTGKKEHLIRVFSELKKSGLLECEPTVLANLIVDNFTCSAKATKANPNPQKENYNISNVKNKITPSKSTEKTLLDLSKLL